MNERWYIDECVSPRAGIVLAHGAGSNANAPILRAVGKELTAAGIVVMRVNLAFRLARQSGPPHPSGGAKDREGLREAVAELRRVGSGIPALLGGHSYGGRQATMLAAEEAAVADGLLLLSYPLHPPDKPVQLRTAHFPSLRTPAVFIHGDRDPFGSPDEMRAALALIAGPAKLVIAEKRGHDLGGAKPPSIAVHVDGLLG